MRVSVPFEPLSTTGDTPAEALRRAKAIGADGVHVCARSAVDSSQTEDDGALMRLAEAARTTGPSISAIVTRLDGLGVDTGHPGKLPNAEASPSGIFSVARQCGASVVIMRSTPGVRAPTTIAPRHEDQLAAMLRLLGRVRFIALREAVSLALELPYGGLLNSSSEARRFMDEINSPHVGLSLDLSALAQDHDLVDWLVGLGRHVISIRLSETEDAGPSLNDLDMLAIGAALKRIRFEGYVFIDCKHDESRLAESIALVREKFA